MYKIYSELNGKRIYLSDEFITQKGERYASLLGIDLFNNRVSIFQDSEEQDVRAQFEKLGESIEFETIELAISAFKDLIEVLKHEIVKRDEINDKII